MTEPVVEADRCHFPGCDRARRPDPATGRPTRYCGQADPDGGPVHNPASAWRARQARAGTGTPSQEQGGGLAAPVSLARANLEQQLAELPERLGALRQYFDGVVAAVREAGDVEAAGAEVEDAHRDALSKVTEADRRTSAAERAARRAEERADGAERDRDEADALVAAATAELERVREEASAEVAKARADAEADIIRARQQFAEAEEEYRNLLAERDSELEQARGEATAARLAAAAAQAAQEAANADADRERETATQLRAELDQARRDADETRQRLQALVDAARDAAQQASAETATVRSELATSRAEASAAQRAEALEREAAAALREELDRQRTDAQSERQALRAAHAEQLANIQRGADDRVQSLNEALATAREIAATYRAQLGMPEAGESTPAPRKQSGRTQRPKRDDGKDALT
ncbi:coiled-coil domain-containing protein [Mycobacteroides abscessus]|uniref:hypothetical protein n=1 Tax=Mycobacteroides abscessus TaxID=36809 RepID=UPI00190F6E69|nr:hypothetical protein [Mycobacteroides abscessus]